MPPTVMGTPNYALPTSGDLENQHAHTEARAPLHPRHEKAGLLAVAADRFDWAAFHRFF